MSVSPNLKAFLDTIATSELGTPLLLASDDGYNVLVGSTADHPQLFGSYADHPRQLIFLPRLGIKSTAAGRYQLLARYFDIYRKQLGLNDFSRTSQDAIATQQIREEGGLTDIEAGRFDVAVEKCRKIWASLPGAGYGQHENALADLRHVYLKAGGQLT